MNLKELWIGEMVRVISSGRIGKFEGLAQDGRARVSSHAKTYLIKADNLKIYNEPKFDKVKELEAELNTKKITPINSELSENLDLHIKKLNPSLLNGLPEHILNHQLNSCKSYISDAIKARKYYVTVIHGKGAGVLRSEVLEILKSFDEVDYCEEVNNGGAQRVYFKY